MEASFQVILGVDRLDYTKGLVARIAHVALTTVLMKTMTDTVSDYIYGTGTVARTSEELVRGSSVRRGEEMMQRGGSATGDKISPRPSLLK